MKPVDPSPAHGEPAVSAVQPAWLELIREAVGSVDFGTIQIKVHDGAVVQIETTRKLRVPPQSQSTTKSTNHRL